MRKVLLVLCIAGLMQSAAYASLLGSWSLSTAGGKDTWTLTVTPTAGEIMSAFDIAVWDTKAGTFADGGDWVGPAVFSTNATNQKTHFLLNSTGVLAPIQGADSSDLYAGLAAVAGGVYDHTATGGVLGWNSALALLQVTTPAGEYQQDGTRTPIGMSIARSDEETVYPIPVAVGVIQGAVKENIIFVPEPGTLALLGCSLFGLLAYAWRKRK